MDELQKAAMRNYCTAAGFFIIAAQFLIRILASFFGQDYLLVVTPVMKGIVPAIIVGLVAVSVILIILKKRDLTVMTFLLFVLHYGFIYVALGSRTAGSIIIAMFSMIIAVMIITSKSKSKYPIFIIPALLGISLLFAPIIGTDSVLLIGIRLLITVICFYYAFACFSERVNLPFSEFIRADSEMNFRASGSALGYIMFGITSAALAIFEISDGALLSASSCSAISECCGILMFILGILLFASEKMQYTPVLFILAGILIYMSRYISGILILGTGIMFIFIGLFSVLRKDARILPVFMMIAFGIACYSSVFLVSGIIPGSIFLIPAVIAVYLGFGLISYTKLPLV